MKFPLQNISKSNLRDEDPLNYILFDQFIYTDSEIFHNEYLKNQSFCDCLGDIYTIKNISLPTEWWRKAFKFLPNVYKVELIFQITGKRIKVDELKDYMIERIREMSRTDRFNIKWINYIRNAKTHKEIIDSNIE